LMVFIVILVRRTKTTGTVATAVARTDSGRSSWEFERSFGMGTRRATIRLKRVYESPTEDDGNRILVERLWPRGVSKAKAEIDLWLKEVAPSAELRKWYGHDSARWEEFRRRYRAELDERGEVLSDLKRRLKEGTVTFVYAAKDEEHNSAVVLKEYLGRDPRS
jgi:uncharacterized protein YeaO (DUF488 family)